MSGYTKACDMGGCEAEAVIELSSRRIDGPMGWRRGIACKDHALSVANWVAHDFDDMQYLRPIAKFNHVTREWDSVGVSDER